jgi:ATP-dependent helicase/nuclease subunit A
MRSGTAEPRRTSASPIDLEAQDALARDRALDPERSILLQAPAGSGKTTVLTQRFLRLLAHVDEPEEILAVTFTRKAAGEMRARILNALGGQIDAASDSEGRLAALASHAREHSAARGWDLVSNPGRLRIQTIDALNFALAAQLPVAARMAAGLQPIDRAERLYQRAARRTLIDADGDAQLSHDLERLLERLDNDPAHAERLFAAMLGARAQWLPFVLGDAVDELPERVIASLASIVSDRLQLASAAIPPDLVKRGFSLVQRAGRDPAPRSVDAAASDPSLPLATWRSVAALALTERGEWRRALSKNDGFPREDAALKAEALEWLDSMARVSGPARFSWSWLRCRTLASAPRTATHSSHLRGS